MTCQEIKSVININNRKHEYTLKKNHNESTFLECVDAGIAGEFLNEDIPNLIMKLPSMIIAEKGYEEKQNQVIRFRVSTREKETIEKKAVESGFTSVSSFMRNLVL